MTRKRTLLQVCCLITCPSPRNEQPGGEPGSASGFLQVFHAGAGGTTCDGAISEGYYYYGTESQESLQPFDPEFVRVPPVISDV